MLLESRHAEELFALTDANRTHLRAWLPWVDSTTSVEDSRAFIEAVRQQFASERGFSTGIFYEGRLAGMVGLHAIDWQNRATSIGYWLALQYQGRGIITRACRELLNYALLDLCLNRVEIRCAPGNLRSRAIAERLGFRTDGVLRHAEWLYDHFVDLVVYSVLAEEWKGLQAKL